MVSDEVLKNAEDMVSKKELNERIADTLRFLSIDAVQKANSGHPGMPMGCADMATVLYARILNHNPKNPHWFNRDRFVLSAGHGSALLYSALHLCGYGLTIDDLINFRQMNSNTPGHPEYGKTSGVETTTGPLGQGFANGVGMAIAAKWFGANFNTPDFPDLINPYIYAIVSDGDMMEGISSEAASFAGHNGLDNMIYLYDDNKISIDGSTDLSFTEDVCMRFEAYGWHVQKIDGHDQEAVYNAIKIAQESKGKPHLIAANTVIGYGCPNKAGTADCHGAPLGEGERDSAKNNLNWPLEPKFFVAESIKDFFANKQKDWEQNEVNWNNLFDKYTEKYPEKAKQLKAFLNKELPENIGSLPEFKVGEKIATRKASGMTLEKLFPVLGNLIGGSADLTPSNNTFIKGFGTFSKSDFGGRNFHFGVREHAMGGILNGMALFGGVIPYSGTFFMFSDYMRPSIRLAALMELQVIYVFTHDSVFLGEDGPTHQPIEQLATMRAVPNLSMIRTADAKETAAAWETALKRKDGPTALILTRQNLPVFDWDNLPACPKDVEKGAYVIYGNLDSNPDLVIVSSGSETAISIDACKKLSDDKINAVCINVPSWDLFEKQSSEYKNKIFPKNMPPVLLVEAAYSIGWERYLGRDFERITTDNRFGMSAPAEVIAKELGFTVENIIAKSKKVIS